MDEAVGTLQFGVLGVGPVWRRLAPALLAEPERQRVVLIADQNRRRADDVAAALRCPSSPSAGRLLRHPEVDVLLLADPQWHALWALEEAVKNGKPVLSTVPLGAEPSAFERLEPLLNDAPRTVHFIEPWGAPALISRARDLQADALGLILQLHAVWATPCARRTWADFARLLQLVGDLVDGRLAAAQAIGGGDVPAALFLEGETGWSLLLRVEAKAAKPSLRVNFGGPRGSASLRWPNRLRWRSGAAVHQERLKWTSPVPTALAQFHELVWSGQRDETNHQAALASARILHAAWKSAAAGGTRLAL